MSQQLLIFGTGLLSEVLEHAVRHEWGQRVAAYTVDGAYCTTTTHLGAPLIPFEELTTACPPTDYHFLMAVGYAGLNSVRGERADALKRSGYTPASFVSTKASVADNATLGEGCLLFENVVVHPRARLGRNVLIWPHAYIGHHSHIGHNVFIGSNASVNGGVSVGDYSLIGAGAVVRDFVNVGTRCIVGAGSVLLRHLPDNALCHGGESHVTFDKTPSMALWPPRTERA